MTKPIMHGCEIAILLNYSVHVFQVKGFTINNYTVPKLLGLNLISELLVADLSTMLLLLGLAIFYTLGVFV